MAKDDATREVLDDAPMLRPDGLSREVAALLTRERLYSAYSVALFGPPLGIRTMTDLRRLTEADLQRYMPQMLVAHRRQLLAAVAPAGMPRTVAAAPVPAAPAAARGHRGQPCDVFLSYRVHETGDGPGGDSSVFALADGLRAHGFSVFVAETALQVGDVWPLELQAGVRNCKAFVVLCSPTYGGGSGWTMDEIAMARNLDKPILPVWHSGAYPPELVHIYLGSRQRLPTELPPHSNGYVTAGIHHDSVVARLVEALARERVVPSNRRPL